MGRRGERECVYVKGKRDRETEGWLGDGRSSLAHKLDTPHLDTTYATHLLLPKVSLPLAHASMRPVVTRTRKPTTPKAERAMQANSMAVATSTGRRRRGVQGVAYLFACFRLGICWAGGLGGRGGGGLCDSVSVCVCPSLPTHQLSSQLPSFWLNQRREPNLEKST